MVLVVEAVKNKNNAILESPTGTGKTLSLLCASLAWLIKAKTENEGCLTKILYASRTHSQLKQVVGELKKTVYKPNMVILGSRDQYCINEFLFDLKVTQYNKK